MAFVESLPGASPDGSADAVLADAARAVRTGPARLAALARDLADDPPARMDEARRTRMRAVLAELTHAVEGRIRRDLAVRLAGGLSPDRIAMLGDAAVPVPDMRAAIDPELVAVVARRVDEHRLSEQARIAIAQDPLLLPRPVLPTLAAGSDAGVAGAARALLAQDGVRVGRFGEPVLLFEDLPPPVRARLAWRIAAAIRTWIGTPDDPAIDRAAAAAGAVLLGADGAGHDALATALARAMLRIGTADDAGTVAFAVEGHVAVAVAGLALRAGIDMATAWDMTLDPGGARLAVLLRAAGMARSAAAELMLRWPDATAAFETIADRMAAFDALSDAAAQAAIDRCRLDPGYLAALVALGGRRAG